MGNLPQNEAAAEAIDSLEKLPATNLVRAWGDVPVVPPQVLRDWINEAAAVLLNVGEGIVDNAGDIRDDKIPQRQQAHAVLTHCQAFLELAHRNGNLLDDEAPPIVSQAFAQGLRLGMVYQNLQVIAKETYLDRWKRDDNIEGDVERRRTEAEKRKQEAIDALEWAKAEFPHMGIDGHKTKAAEKLGIKKAGFNKRLRG